MKTFASLFTGLGGADFGISATGFKALWGVEADSAIAEASRQNHSCVIHNSPIEDINPVSLERPDLLWLSPPCQDYSVANHSIKPGSKRGMVGQYCLKYIEELTPQWVVLENVPQYARSPTFQLIANKLYELGYWVHWQILDAADFGVPQNRKRLILRATHDGLLSSLLPELKPHRSWHKAVEDLIPSLPNSELTGWQRRKMTTQPQPLTLIKRVGARDTVTVRQAYEPSFTVRALGGSRHWRWADCFDDTGQIKRMTPRTSARLQTIPDWVKLPKNHVLAQKMVGNAVPSLFAQKITESLFHHDQNQHKRT